MNSLIIVLSALMLSTATALVVYAALQRVQDPSVFRTRVRKGVRALLRRASLRIAQRLPSKLRFGAEKKIAMAGGLQGMTAELLALSALAGALLGAATGVLLLASTGNPLFILVFALIGLVLPVVWLDDRVKTRHAVMLRQLPFHLDLLTLGVEAGLDFTAALSKMVEKGKPGPLREEFSITLSQIRVGVQRGQAMREMAERVDLPQLTNFLSSLVQADKLGMSVGKVLRVQSETVRQERSQRAEQKANEAPVKILIPLVLFIFPTIWLILFAPIVFSFAF